MRNVFVLKILSKNQILTSIKGRNSVANLRKTMIYLILSMIMCIQNLVLIGLFVFKILGKNSILTLIKGLNSNCKFAEIRTHPSFHACLVTCKNEEDQIENEVARLFTRFLPL